MNKRHEFECFLDQLQDSAVNAFFRTEQYALLRDRLERMEQDCDAMFQSDEKAFAQECFGIITEVEAQKETFVYREAYKDCVSLLKWLGILA